MDFKDQNLDDLELNPNSENSSNDSAEPIDDSENRQSDITTLVDFEKLPSFLKRVSASFDSKDKEMMLLSTITVISSVLPNVYGSYTEHQVYPNLFLYVIGKAGSGKGNMMWARKLLSAIENAKPELNTGSLLQQLIDDSKPFVIPNKIIIPANNSSSGFVKILNDREGKGLIFETEGDTIANVFKTDYGDYSEMLRKSFHHEPITSYRKTDNVYVDINEPKISVVISSTPNQLKRIIPNAENGLFSRFVYVITETTDEFLNVFARKGYNRKQQFDDFSKELYALYQQLIQSDGISFSYTAEQEEQFLSFFNKNKSILMNLFHEDLDGSVHRMGVVTFRISMIFTVLRSMDSLKTDTLVCSDEDFYSSLQLAEKLLVNANKVMEMLPHQAEETLSGTKLQLFQLLPPEFTTAEAKESGRRLGIPGRTIDRFLKTACFEKIEHGKYQKVT